MKRIRVCNYQKVNCAILGYLYCISFVLADKGRRVRLGFAASRVVIINVECA